MLRADNRNSQKLSCREQECLYLLSNGMTQKEIAHHLGVKLRTVEQQVASARKKLAAKTTIQAVVEAIRGGQIDL